MTQTRPEPSAHVLCSQQCLVYGYRWRAIHSHILELGQQSLPLHWPQQTLCAYWTPRGQHAATSTYDKTPPLGKSQGSRWLYTTWYPITTHNNVSRKIHRAQIQAYTQINHLKVFGISHRRKALSNFLHSLYCENNHKIV